MQPSNPALEERPLSELIAQLSRDGSQLVQQEMALAKRELAEKAGKAGRQLGALALGGGVLLLAAFSLTAALILLLAQWLPTWLAALIVGALLAAVGAALALRAKKELGQLDPVPRQAAESVQRDVRAIKEAV